VPDLKEVIVGVNCVFNEIIPSYRDEYFNELKKLEFQLVNDESTVEHYQHLVDESYIDDESLLMRSGRRVGVSQWTQMRVGCKAYCSISHELDYQAVP